jgi:hypothetical protein
MIAQTSFRDTFISLETFETGLNVVGYIPYIGSISAWVRDRYSLLEIITGVGLAILSFVNHRQGDVPASKVYLTVAATFLGHGILNQIRSAIEAVPLLPLVTTLPYDFFATYYIGSRIFSYQALML